jgi:hypothetical protein
MAQQSYRHTPLEFYSPWAMGYYPGTESFEKEVTKVVRRPAPVV